MEIQSVNYSDLLQLKSSANPSFFLWANKAFENGNINLLITALMASEVVATKAEGLMYLQQVAAQQASDDVLVDADFKGITYSQQIKHLEKVLGVHEDRSEKVLFRIFGVLTHKFIGLLFSGIVPAHTTVEYIELKSQALQPNLEFMHCSTSSYALFPNLSMEFNLLDLRDARFQYDLEMLWQNSILLVSESIGWEERSRKIIGIAAEMKKMLQPVLGTYLSELELYRYRCGKWSEYLCNLSVIIWTGAVLHALSIKPKLLFSEIPVLDRSCGFGGRRADALEIETIGGKSLSKSQVITMKKVMDWVARKKTKPISIGSLLSILEAVFEKSIETSILDWKTAVGDFPGSSDFIVTSQACPLPEHTAQVKLYAILSNLGYYLNHNHTESPWTIPNLIQNTALYYLLPTGLPHVVLEKVNSTSQKDGFVELVKRISPAKRQRMIRKTSNFLASHVLKLVNGKPKKSYNYVPASNAQLRLFPVQKSADKLAKIIEQHRVFLDQYQIIEDIGLNGKTSYVMFIDRLLAKIDEQMLPVNKFDDSKGGFVLCLNPKHEDKNPSMHINFQRGIFKCFSCGVGGTLDFASFELLHTRSENPLVIKPHAVIRKQNKHTLQADLPDHLMDLFQKTQDLLHQNFLSSKGAEYIQQERSIEPNLAHVYGAGFGANHVIVSLLKIGFTYQELIDAGLISFRKSVTNHWNLIPVLVKEGFRASELFREITGNKKYKGTKFGIPYFTLMDRITFPLAFGGIVNNFYGRAVWGTDFKHRKLVIADNQYVHGGFNLTVLETNTAEIILAESVMDCLSLISMGYTNAVAVVGVTNYAILETVIGSGKNLAAALNNDNAGRMATERLQKWLLDIKSEHTMRNFTEDFFTKHSSQDDIQWTDYNDWWKNRGFILQTKR